MTLHESTTVVLPPGAIEWLRTGERGASSEAIFSHLTGIPIAQNDRSPPLDPDDLHRCRLLLEAVPAFRAELHRMAELGIDWELLVQDWDTLCVLMDDEAPRWRRGSWSAPQTYQRMKNLSDEARARKRKRRPAKEGP